MSIRYLIKIGEMTLKGENKNLFERRLKKNILTLLPDVRAGISIRDRRFYLNADESSTKRIEEALSHTFGIVAFSRTKSCEKSIEALKMATADEVERYAHKIYGSDLDLLEERTVSFKIEARRTDKSFPATSYEIASEVGAYLENRFHFLKVDVKKPMWNVRIEIREQVFLYVEEYGGPGGLPVGTAGKGILMLSGGIDSPVSGYLMAKRGLSLEAVYFHTYPYTSEEAVEKVKKLAAALAPYTVGMRLHVVPFTDIQLRIKEKTKKEEVTLLMRAGMVEIAHRIAEKAGAGAIVSGESLSQVASQTIASLRFTGSMTDLPLFRPLIGLDKEEIIRIARKIGTFETSILPYDDCCTIFSPAHPLVNPDYEYMQESLKRLEWEELIQRAVEEREIIDFPPASGKKID